MKNTNIELGKILEFLKEKKFEKTTAALIDESSELNLTPVVLNNEKISDLKISYQDGNAARDTGLSILIASCALRG